MTWAGKAVLITGGTGSLGQALAAKLLEYPIRKLVIFSRDELKQFNMRQAMSDERLRFFIGDVRDLPRLRRAFEDVDIVIHAAALKQVEAAEYSPFEPIKTNILGAQNVIEAALDSGVSHVMGVSSDKASGPSTLYGATKLVMEKLFIAATNYVKAGRDIRFACVRYGNVFGSRGSVFRVFEERLRRGESLQVRTREATRFWLTLDEAVNFVLDCTRRMEPRCVYVPKLHSSVILALADAMGGNAELLALTPGEKLHESLIGVDERWDDIGGRYVIHAEGANSRFAYTSENASPVLDFTELFNSVGFTPAPK